MERIRHIHFLGIKGVGMTSLAILAKEAGFMIDGCDLPDSFITSKVLDDKGIKVWDHFSDSHLKGVDILITTGAHGGLNNPEVKKAKEMGIKILTQGEAVGEFMKGSILNRNFIGISVAGCHGKTTTSSLLASVFQYSGFDPSYVIGVSEIFPLGVGGHFGNGNYFIAEADEYATDPVIDKTPKFMWQNPKMAIVTNIDFDHPDVYKDIGEVEKAYFKFAQKVKNNDGKLILNGEDRNLSNIRKKFTNISIIFGNNKNFDYYYKDYYVKDLKTYFKVFEKGVLLDEFEINLMGEHNILNSLTVIAAARYYKIEVKQIKDGLSKFKGSKRRLELIGKTLGGALIYDDYAHHPKEIESTISAVKNNYPNKKIITIFQPHTYSRTKYLFDQFIYSLSTSDIVILTEVYKSKRDSETDKISSSEIFDILLKKTKTFFLKTPEDVVKYIKDQNFNSNYIILILGAGDIYKIGSKLVKC